MPSPKPAEQRQIARVLSAVQRAIERQERLIALTTELKKALMHKLFTEGTRGEPLKQTEIGPVPESWDVAELKTRCRVHTGFAFKSDDYVRAEEGLPIVKIGDLQDEEVRFSERSSYVPKRFWDEPRFYQYRLHNGDLLIALTGATTGKIGEVNFHTPALLNQRVGRFQPDEHRLLSPFHKFLVQQPYFQRSIQTNILVAAQGNISPKSIERFLVALPKPDEQKLIAEVLLAADGRGSAAKSIKNTLCDAFRSLLHQLMTAQIRVHDLDLSALDEPAAEPAEVA